jgi:hypothetical protein
MLQDLYYLAARFNKKEPFPAVGLEMLQQQKNLVAKK